MMRIFLPLAACFASVVSVSAAEPKISQRWAVLVGVDEYAYAQSLQYCGADQVALGKQLVASGFPADQVFVLHDKAESPRFRPSLNNIERQIGLILNLADADDLVVIGFSGHGVHINGKSFLCPAECTLDDPNTLISVDKIYERLRECAAGFKLVVVDACRNDPRPGGSRSMTSTEGTRALARQLQELKLPEGVVLLNSCAPGEISWEDKEFGHGVFMHFVLDGLQGAADTSRDGSVSLHELQAYAGGRTKTFVANRHAVAQRPFFKGDLTTEALEYALLPVPSNLDRFDATKPATLGIFVRDADLQASVWHVLAGGPADAAGVQVDDVLTSVGGQETANGGEFLQAMKTLKPGEPVEMVVERGGKSHTFRATVEAENDERLAKQLLAEAEAGSATAMVYLGYLYVTGENAKLPKDPAEAVRWYRRAADTGDALGLYSLAALYAVGLGVAQDDAETLRLHEAARSATGSRAHAGAYGDSAASLSDMYLAGGATAKDEPRAVALLQEAADVGHARAAYALARRYDQGLGVPQDYARAFEYHQQAAAFHHSAAEFAVGYSFEHGEGTLVDLQAARSWYERAVAHGNAAAEVNLGLFHEEGNGVPVDLARAIALYRSAADKGEPSGMRNLGRLSQEGIGTPVDLNAARDWYERAAAKGDVAANYHLGLLYANGHGVPIDYAKAMHYFQIAAKEKYGDAESDIGYLIQNGLGVRADAAVARGWYEAAAAHGSSLGMFNLAELYEDGEGGPKDLAKAKHWYQKAAELGDEDAKKKLAELQ